MKDNSFFFEIEYMRQIEPFLENLPFDYIYQRLECLATEVFPPELLDNFETIYSRLLSNFDATNKMQKSASKKMLILIIFFCLKSTISNHDKFFISLASIVNYFIKIFKGENYAQKVYNDLFPAHSSLENLSLNDDISKNDIIDFNCCSLISYLPQFNTSWVRAKVLYKDENYCKIRILHSNKEMKIPTHSILINDLNTHTKDFEWRITLKPFDVIACWDRARWFPATVLEVFPQKIYSSGIQVFAYKIGFRIYPNVFKNYHKFQKVWMGEYYHGRIDEEGRMFMGDVRGLDEFIPYYSPRIQKLEFLLKNNLEGLMESRNQYNIKSFILETVVFRENVYENNFIFILISFLLKDKKFIQQQITNIYFLRVLRMIINFLSKNDIIYFLDIICLTFRSFDTKSSWRNLSKAVRKEVVDIIGIFHYIIHGEENSEIFLEDLFVDVFVKTTFEKDIEWRKKISIHLIAEIKNLFFSKEGRSLFNELEEKTITELMGSLFNLKASNFNDTLKKIEKRFSARKGGFILNDTYLFLIIIEHINDVEF
jgi:hypothetical protein